MKLQKIFILVVTAFNSSILSMDKNNDIDALTSEVDSKLVNIFNRGSGKAVLRSIEHEINLNVAQAALKKDKNKIIAYLKARESFYKGAFLKTNRDYFRKAMEDAERLMNAVKNDLISDEGWQSISEYDSMVPGESAIQSFPA